MEDSDGMLLPHGGYENLRSYKVAEAVYDATVVFCDRFYQGSRTHDQMVQAARSGVRNISEGSGAAATSRKSELKLTNVARASLSDELLKDYRSFLTHRGLRVWLKDEPEAKAMRRRLREDRVIDLPPCKAGTVQLTGLDGLADFVAKSQPETAANAMLCAVNQAVYLLKKQIERLSRDFIEYGGFTERMYATRLKARTADRDGPVQAAGKSNRKKEAEAPQCRLCGKSMCRRTATRGPHTGEPFWGCSDYPNCKGIRRIDE